VLSFKAPAEVRRKVGNAIKKARIDHDMSQADLADAAEISVSYLSQIERGIRSIPTARLKVIADSLGMSLSELLTYAKTEERDPWLDPFIKAATLIEELANVEKTLRTPERRRARTVGRRIVHRE
jgi:transcriptional regulator with XRE-family HTH domain